MSRWRDGPVVMVICPMPQLLQTPGMLCLPGGLAYTSRTKLFPAAPLPSASLELSLPRLFLLDLLPSSACSLWLTHPFWSLAHLWPTPCNIPICHIPDLACSKKLALLPLATGQFCPVLPPPSLSSVNSQHSGLPLVDPRCSKQALG